MNLRVNDTEIEIKKTFYNKTIVSEDGITHIVDPAPHYAFQFGMAKNYFIEDDDEFLDALIGDLGGIIDELEKIKTNNKEKSKVLKK